MPLFRIFTKQQQRFQSRAIHTTYSAWIYEELKIAHSLIADSALQESRIKAMRVSHNITNLLRRFKSISLDSLCNEIFSTLL